jgi:hypothetical protein
VGLNVTTLRLSISGREIVEAARQEKGWTTGDERWLKEATQLSSQEPPMGWPKFWEENPENFTPSKSTLKNKFLKCQYIRRDNFIALCQAVGVVWERVADLDCPSIIGDPPELMDFYGRSTAVGQLQQWMKGKTRLIVVHGRAGMGKSSLARHVLNSVADQFDVLIWRSLESALPLSEWLEQLNADLRQQGNLSEFMEYLCQHKCLVVLDQWETLLKDGSSGQYQKDYQEYQNLLQRMVGDRHQSCVILLSREKPQDFLLQLGGSAVQCLHLEGLKYPEDKEFLAAEKLLGTELELKSFIKQYNNPLIVKAIAQKARTVQGGKVSLFVDPQVSSVLHVEDISVLMDGEFKRLSTLEQDILYWLAIWRNPVSYEQLHQCILSSITPSELIYTLDALIAKHSIVKVQSDPDSEYWLEPITLRYVTHRFVKQTVKTLSEAIQKQDLKIAKLLWSHAFNIGDDPEIQKEQLRRIVKPTLDKLLEDFSLIQLSKIFEKMQSKYFFVESTSSEKFINQNLKTFIAILK